MWKLFVTDDDSSTIHHTPACNFRNIESHVPPFLGKSAKFLSFIHDDKHDKQDYDKWFPIETESWFMTFNYFRTVTSSISTIIPSFLRVPWRIGWENVCIKLCNRDVKLVARWLNVAREVFQSGSQFTSPVHVRQFQITEICQELRGFLN